MFNHCSKFIEYSTGALVFKVSSSGSICQTHGVRVLGYYQLLFPLLGTGGENCGRPLAIGGFEVAAVLSEDSKSYACVHLNKL